MRLTLRTLLAYLDDVLDPSQTREIGQKIRESPRAAALVSRIREAIRRRRLGAPELDGPGQGLDPNLVAAYLDDSLTPEQVVDLEQVCLDADVQLAEVAACHQILTLVWSESLDLPQSTLDRYYALGPVPFDERLHVEGGDGAAARAMSTATVVMPAESRIPDYLKPSPWSQRIAPLAGVAVVVILAALLLAPDRELFRGLTKRRAAEPRVARNDTLVPLSPSNQPEPPNRDGNDAAAAQPMPPSGAPSDAVSAVSALPRGIDPTPPPDAPEPMPVAAAPAKSGAAPAVPAPPAANAAPNEKPEPPAPAIVRVPIQYTSIDGVLVRFDSDDQQWYVQPRRSEVQANETFASPDPFESQFDFDRGAFKVTLLAESAIQILPGTPAVHNGIRLQRGRVVLQPGAKGGPERLDFALEIGQLHWQLRFSGPDAVAGVEVLLREPAGFEKALGPDSQQAAITVGAGALQINPGAEQPKTLVVGQREVLTGGPWPSAGAGDVPMVWLNPQHRERGETLRRFASKFEKEFDPTLSVNMSIPALTKDPNPKIAELATRCLSVIAAYPELVQTLVEAEHEESRAVAIHGIRVWLALDRERCALLTRELARYYSKEEGRTIYRLLWGLTPDDAKNKVTSAELIEWLGSNRVEIRELAFQQCVLLTGRKYDYRPLDGISLRERAIQRWIAHMQREGGSLLRAE